MFALMLASDRKYLNPSTAIEVLKHSFSSGEAGQTAHSSNGQQVRMRDSHIFSVNMSLPIYSLKNGQRRVVFSFKDHQ